MWKLFEILSIFDWITPSIGIIEDVINDPTPLQANSWTFFIPYKASVKQGWNAFDIEGLMSNYGIKTWGSQITNGEFFFKVKREQAQWAEYLLLSNGVPINERFLGAPPPKRKTGQSQRGAKKSNGDSFFDDLFDDFLDDDDW